MSVHHVRTYCPQRPEKGIRSLWTRVRNDRELLYVLGMEPKLSARGASLSSPIVQ